MIIDWLGHSCFLVTLKNGARVLFDPYDGSIGYTQKEVEADIVVISHGHRDHSDLSYVKGDFTVVDQEGVTQIGDVTFTGIKTWHDHSEGEHRGVNLIFTLSISGITLCHMGDIGSIPSESVLSQLEKVEILLIPVGGNYTIDADEALQICERISPNVIIPMHFKTPASNLDIAPLHDFLEAADGEYDVSHPGKNYLMIDKASLKKRTRIVVMEYL